MAQNETLDWGTFEQRLKELRANHQKESSPLLFRGQGNSDWLLTTTLERSGARHMLFSEYYRLICASIGPEVKTFAHVDVPEYNAELCKPFLKANLLYEIGDVFPIHVYRYMAYLRHLGSRRRCSTGRGRPSWRHSSLSGTSRRTGTARRGRFLFTARSQKG